MDSLQSTVTLHAVEFASTDGFRRGHEMSAVEPGTAVLMRHYFAPFESSISSFPEWGNILCRDFDVCKLYNGQDR